MTGDGRGPHEVGAGGITCREAAERVYEYLDGELDPERAEEVHEHIRVCQRCWPYFDFERLFLRHIRDKGRRPEPSRELKERLRRILREVD